jgi:preprotein translocase subunit SecG
MLNLNSILLLVHVLISAGIIGLVLLQRGKGADAGAAFGAGASGTVFGARGSTNFLSRTTAVLATLFFASSLSLAYLGTRQAPTESLMDGGLPADGISSTLPGGDEPGAGMAPMPLADPLPLPPINEEAGGTSELPAVPGLDGAEEVNP